MFQAVRALAVASLFVAVAAPVLAQEPLADPPTSPQFMSRFDFEMWANGLGSDDPRFTWDTHWAGDFDFVDYVYGRLSFLADYQALLGEEFRPFDPYQSNYYLAVSGSIRRGANEFVFVFHHVSRHLGDRPKRDSVAMNAALGRYLRRLELDGMTLDVKADLGPVVERAWVDYTWIGSGELVLRRPLSSAAGMYGRAFGQTIWVDESIAGRGRQWGTRLEAGVRLAGSAGAIELFGGFERMIDADPLARITRQWAFAGFRLTGRQ
jgi:hypothetical protein